MFISFIFLDFKQKLMYALCPLRDSHELRSYVFTFTFFVNFAQKITRNV